MTFHENREEGRKRKGLKRLKGNGEKRLEGKYDKMGKGKMMRWEENGTEIKWERGEDKGEKEMR